MKPLSINKKGQGLAGLGGLALSVVFIIILVAAGALILSEFQDSDAVAAGSIAENATLEGLTALDDLAGWMPLIVIIVIASVIIGIISMVGGRGGKR